MNKIIPIALALAAPAISQASLLVYEGFDYGLAAGASMNGVATDATGLTGNYAVSVTGGAAGSGMTYRGTGLSFGSKFATTGGAIALTANAAATSAAVLGGAAFNTGAQTGTIYNSYLVSFESRTAAGTASFRLNTGITASGASSYFGSNAKAAGSTALSSVSYSTTAVSATTSLANNPTTYLFINSFTNVGSSGGGVATTWIFDVAGFDQLLADGVLTDAKLDQYRLHKISQTNASGSAFVFDNTRFMQFGSSSGTGSGSQISVFDEIRYGNALADVIPVAVPEPSAYAAIAGAIMLGAAMTRRRANRRSAGTA